MHRLQLLRNSVVLVIAIVFLIGCPQQGLKPLNEMSPQEKATWMLSIYSAQYDDYKLQVVKPDLTDDQKNILREKKKILLEVDPLIDQYTGYVDTGILPTMEIETLIINNLDRLLSL